MQPKTGVDAHCHIEHMENPEEVAAEIRQRMLAAVCSVPNPKDFEKILELRKKFEDCVFVCLGLHPEYIFDYTIKQIEEYMEFIKDKKKEIVGVGEIGIDYNCIKEKEKQERTKEIFIQLIGLAKEMKLPMVIHTRNDIEHKKDAVSDALKVLTDEKCEECDNALLLGK